MNRAAKTLKKWNEKLDGIWREEGNGRRGGAAAKRPVRERAGSFVREHRLELLFIAMMGCLLFFLAWVLPFNGGPDEAARYLVPKYIYKHGTLPHGGDPEIRMKIWGISYAFHPILPYIIGGYLMKAVGLFNSSDHALLMAARFVNILIGMGFYWYVLQISRVLFKRNVFRVYFVALLALLPQLLYLFVYVNTDGIALFSTAMILYYWLVGLERRWDRGSCTGLAIGVSCCALSYFNAYGFALFSVILFAGSLIVFYGRRGVKECIRIILQRGIFITAIVFLLSGWWFIRCAVLYDGDFLGLNAPNYYAEKYADEEYKPSVKKSVQEQGVPLDEMLRNEADGGMEWKITTYRSTIGFFGFFEYPLGLDIYEIHKRLFRLGVLGVLLYPLLAVLWYMKRGVCRLAVKRGWRRRWGQPSACGSVLAKPAMTVPGIKLHPANFCLLQFSLGCCMIIPIFLSLYYSYTDDFQPQGRYIMTMIIPVMYFTAAGTERLMTLCFRKWFVRLLMVPILYAVLHVFLAAFISVYLPSYCEAFAWMADIRFPWFSNQGWLVQLLYLFIPG